MDDGRAKSLVMEYRAARYSVFITGDALRPSGLSFEYWSTSMIPEIQQHRKEIEALCRRYGVLRLEVFGSAGTGGYRPNSSDLDFLVEFESQSAVGCADRYFGLLEGLEALFKRPVDLVVTSAIKNPYFRESVERTKALLYAA